MSIKAMVLAAGRGERMRPLTDVTPKPLLEVHGKPLIQWAIEALAAGGFTELVVNTAWLGEQVPNRLRHDFPDISYSHEGRDFGGALETAGGIARALPSLGDVFWVVAGDVFAPDFMFTRAAVERFAASGLLAHLWLVPNPPHNPNGDFGLDRDGFATNAAVGPAASRYTFSTIALYSAALFALPNSKIPPGNPGGIKLALAPLLRAAIEHRRVSAQIYTGPWTDVGTPERLAALNAAAPE